MKSTCEKRLHKALDVDNAPIRPYIGDAEERRLSVLQLFLLVLRQD